MRMMLARLTKWPLVALVLSGRCRRSDIDRLDPRRLDPRRLDSLWLLLRLLLPLALSAFASTTTSPPAPASVLRPVVLRTSCLRI